MKKFTLVLAFVLFAQLNCFSADVKDSVSTEDLIRNIIRQDSMINALHYRTGKIVIGDNLATVTVPEGCYFLDTKDARILLEQVNHNPPDPEILGLLLSEKPSTMTGVTWAVTYAYSSDGHVKDDDAKDLNYDELLEKMKKETDEASIERVKTGYSSMKLLGWAQPPFYDATNRKLHWAKEYQFDGDSAHTLNYDVRILGRKGYLEMVILSGMDKFNDVKNNIDKILASTNFNEGNTYADFDSKVDKIAEYGIGGLIAGGILAKTGLLAKIGILLFKFWKLIALAIGGFFVSLRNKIFGKKKSNEVMPAVIPETTNDDKA